MAPSAAVSSGQPLSRRLGAAPVRAQGAVRGCVLNAPSPERVPEAARGRSSRARARVCVCGEERERERERELSFEWRDEIRRARGSRAGFLRVGVEISTCVELHCWQMRWCALGPFVWPLGCTRVRLALRAAGIMFM